MTLFVNRTGRSEVVLTAAQFAGLVPPIRTGGMTMPDNDFRVDFRDDVDPAEVEQLGADNPNVAAGRDSDDVVDHEQLIGDFVDDDPVLDAERAVREDDLAGGDDQPDDRPAVT